MPRFSQEEPESWSRLLEDALDAADAERDERRIRDLTSKVRVARFTADGPFQ